MRRGRDLGLFMKNAVYPRIGYLRYFFIYVAMYCLLLGSWWSLRTILWPEVWLPFVLFLIAVAAAVIEGQLVAREYLIRLPNSTAWRFAVFATLLNLAVINSVSLIYLYLTDPDLFFHLFKYTGEAGWIGTETMLPLLISVMAIAHLVTNRVFIGLGSNLELWVLKKRSNDIQ